MAEYTCPTCGKTGSTLDDFPPCQCPQMRNVQLIGGPKDGEWVAWDGGDIMHVQHMPPVPLTVAPGPIPDTVRSISTGTYRRLAGEDHFTWQGWTGGTVGPEPVRRR